MDYDVNKMIAGLSKDDWDELTDIYKEITNHAGKLAEYTGESVEPDGAIVLGTTELAQGVRKAMRYFDDKKLVIPFDWGQWDEGRAIFTRKGEDKFEDVSLENTLKLFTAVMRNNRFNEGAWGRLFESGDGIKLLKHLLTFNPHTNA